MGASCPFSWPASSSASPGSAPRSIVTLATSLCSGATIGISENALF